MSALDYIVAIAAIWLAVNVAVFAAWWIRLPRGHDDDEVQL